MLRAQGSTWRDLGFARAMPRGRFLIYTMATVFGVSIATTVLITPLVKFLGAPPLDVGALQTAIEGDLLNYLIFLIPITWGSAAIGEELIARGFLLDRFMRLYRPWVAVIAQATLFALAHIYQGPTGVANTFVVALVFGAVYLRSGRNLGPLITAHGIIDTVGVTLIYLGQADQLVGAQ